MLSIRTQAAIAVLHDISSDNDLQSATFILSEGEWKNILDKLEEGNLLRLLPDKKPGIPSSYGLCRPLPDISLLNVLKAMDEVVYYNTPIPESFYAYHRAVATKIGVLDQVARTFLEGIKMSDW